MPGPSELSATADGTLMLRAASESLRASGHAVAALDAGGRVAVWDDRAEALLGWSASTAVGRSFFDLLVGPSRMSWADGLPQLAAGRSWQGELEMEGPRGRPVRVDVSADPVGPEGDYFGAVLVVRPLTARELERRLQELSTLLQLTPDAVVVADAQGRIREWNPAAEALFGWSRTVMIGSPLLRLVPVDCRADVELTWAKLADGQLVAPYETHRTASDGTRQHVSVHTAALRERGTFVGAIASFRRVSPGTEGERLLSELIAAVPVVVAAYDTDSRVTFAGGGGYLREGVTPTFALGTRLLSALPEGTVLHAAIESSLTGRVSQVRALLDDRVWQCHVAPAIDGGFLSAFDVTSEQVVSDRLQALLAAAPLAFVTFDATGRATFAAGSAFSAMSVDSEDLVGLDLLELYRDSPDIRQALQRCLRGHRVDLVTRRAGRRWDLHYRSYRDSNGSITGGVCIAQDSTDWRTEHPVPLAADSGGGAARPPPAARAGPSSDDPAATSQLEQRLDRDRLTGLPARRGTQRGLNAPLLAGRVRVAAVVELEDMDLLSQQHGYDGADVTLQVIAGRMLTAAGQGFIGRASRAGFVVVVDTAEPAGLLQDAEANVGEARARRPDRHRWPPVAGQEPHSDTIAQVARLRGALHDELVLHYQPVIDLQTYEAVAVEALIRWQHPTRGLLAPGAFIPLAERSGLLHDLSRWTMQQGCQQALVLAAQPTRPRVALNVSAGQLSGPTLVQHLVEVLAETGCPAGLVTLEITETALIPDLDGAVATLRQLKELGVRLALDDFGTGYSSLLYLRRFPVDELKLDRSFIAGLGVSAEDAAIVDSTISLAHNLGVQCVAEGVETARQLELLTSMGCDRAQGYLFSPALLADELHRWLTVHALAPRPQARPPHAPEEPEILQLHREGASLNTIAASLNLQGRRTPKGTRWNAKSVARVIARHRPPDPGSTPTDRPPPSP